MTLSGETRRETRRETYRVLPLVALFGIAGVLHFVTPGFFLAIVPSWVPDAGLAVAVSGVGELLGAAGLLLPRTRRLAAWGLIALLLAVFPANLHMLQQARANASAPLWEATLWLRLPLQALLIWWIWRVALARRPSRRR